MTEAQPARHGHGAHEVAFQQDVERVECDGGFLLGDRDGQIELERLAHQRRRIEQRSRSGRQPVELDRQGRDHRFGHLELVVLALAWCRGRADACELLEIEGIAAAQRAELLRALGRGAPREQRHGVGLRQRSELDPLQEAAPCSGVERRDHRAAAVPGSAGQREHEPARRGPAQHVREHLHGGLVGPVEIVDDHQRAAAGRQSFE